MHNDLWLKYNQQCDLLFLALGFIALCVFAGCVICYKIRPDKFQAFLKRTVIVADMFIVMTVVLQWFV